MALGLSFQARDAVPENVRCADCGFLAIKRRWSGEWVEAEESLREEGFIKYVAHERAPTVAFEIAPFCFDRAADLQEEIGPLDTGRATDGSLNAKRAAAVQLERPCGNFVQWEYGFSPKEHAEMRIVQQQQEWHAKEAAAQREWQADEARKADVRHRESMNVALAANKDNVWSTIIAGAVGASATIVAAAATLGAVLLARWLSG
jgi:hypothetical protein